MLKTIIHYPLRSVATHPWLFLLIVLGLPVFCFALLGIFSRPIGLLAAVWPANPLLLGLMIRVPRCRRPLGWAIASLAFIAADLITGAKLSTAVILTGANLMGIAAGLVLVSKMPPSTWQLEHKFGVLGMLAIAIIAAFSAGLMGMFIYPFWFNGTAQEGLIYWFVTELVNYIAFLPVILTAPRLASLSGKSLHSLLRPTALLNLLPGALVPVLCYAALYVDGPAAIAIPLIALLWCSLSYTLFNTALLTLFFCIWTLLAVAQGHIAIDTHLSSWNVTMSWRLGISMIALVPIVVASQTQIRVKELAQLTWSANHDPLTGILNRRGFFNHFQRILSTSSSHPLSLAILDLDHFKAVNDQYGHPCGDEVLKNVAAAINNSIGNSAIFGRLGGEEFALLLPHHSDDDVNRVIEAIRTNLHATPTIHEDGTLISVTLSIGLTQTTDLNAKADELILEADQALYLAKDQGRNRAVRFKAKA